MDLISELNQIESIDLAGINLDLGQNKIGLKENNIKIRVKSPEDIEKWEYFSKVLRDFCRSYGSNEDWFTPPVKLRKPIIILEKGADFTFIFPDDELDNAVELFTFTLSRKFYLIKEPELNKNNIIAKVTNNCNLDCEYCYDIPFRHQLGHYGHITYEKFDRMVKMCADHARAVDICFHGGEPSFVGLKFYRKIIDEILPKYPYCYITLNMQTNGTLLNEDWFNFIKECRDKGWQFGLGTSYNALFDNIRYTDAKTGNVKAERSDRVLDNMKLGGKMGVPLSAIEVVTRQNIKSLIEIHEWYKRNNLQSVFNVVYRSGAASDSSILFEGTEAMEEYRNCVYNYFVYWLNDRSPRNFNDRFAAQYISIVTGGDSAVCEHSKEGCLMRWLGVNSSGDIYNCDRALPRKYHAGNVMQYSSVVEVYENKNYQKLLQERRNKFNNYCSKCSYFTYCHSGCPMKDVDVHGSADKPNENACELFKIDFECAYKALFKTDINTCNQYARQYFIEKCIVLPKEIPQLIEELGMTEFFREKYGELDFSEENAKVFSKEFEVFQTFNPFDGLDRPWREGTLYRGGENHIPDSKPQELRDDRFEHIKEGMKKLSKEKLLEIKAHNAKEEKANE